MKSSILIIAFLISAQTYAGNINIIQNSQNVIVQNIILQKMHPEGCIDEQWVELKTTPAGKTKCTVTEPLSLELTSKSYPLMNNMTFNVQFWSVEIEKTQAYKSVYDRYITNICTKKQVAVLRESVVWNTSEVDGIDNPNLSEKTSHSYELSPLTEQEATQQLVLKLSNCN